MAVVEELDVKGLTQSQKGDLINTTKDKDEDTFISPTKDPLSTIKIPKSSIGKAIMSQSMPLNQKFKICSSRHIS